MLTRGNKKLGHRLIWGFALPSGTNTYCPGRTSICSRYCYSKRIELLRPQVRKAYHRNYLLTQRKDFRKRVYHFLRAHRVRVVRIHIGGDFYSVGYTQKWLRIIEKSPRTRFYFYRRSWQDPPIRSVLEQMAAIPNCYAWFSCDAETGVPANLPARVRLAWLQVNANEVVPESVDLVFRQRGIRRRGLALIDPRVCREQDGLQRAVRVTCDVCQYCLRPEATVASCASTNS